MLVVLGTAGRWSRSWFPHQMCNYDVVNFDVKQRRAYQCEMPASVTGTARFLVTCDAANSSFAVSLTAPMEARYRMKRPFRRLRQSFVSDVKMVKRILPMKEASDPVFSAICSTVAGFPSSVRNLKRLSSKPTRTAEVWRCYNIHMVVRLYTAEIKSVHCLRSIRND
jgi:hypothetical protein